MSSQYTFFAAGGSGYTPALAGGNMTVPLPSGLNDGVKRLLLLHTGCNSISVSPPDSALAALGFTKLNVNTNAPCVCLYAYVTKADGTDPASVTFQWDGTTQAYARIFGFGGNVYTDLSTIVAAFNDRGTNSTGRISVNATSAPSVPNCMAIRCGHCVKSPTNNGSSFNDWLVDNGVYSQITPAYVPNGNAIAAGFWWDQQSAAAATDADSAALTNTDTSANSQSITILLKTASGAALAGQGAVAANAAASLATAIRMLGSANAGVAASSALTNWSTVTLTGTQYTGPGGIHDPNFWTGVDPPVGTTLYYDASKATVYANGEISSTSNDCSFVVQFFDGTAWNVGIVVITPQMVSYTNVVAAAAATLSTAIQMAGAALASVSTLGSLTTGIHLAGNALAIANAAASMVTGIQLNASAMANIAATGALTGGQASLQGNAQVLSQAVAQLTTRIALAAQVAVNSTVAGALGAQIVLDGAAVALTQANAQIQTAINLAGNANVVSSAAGAALLTTAFAGAANVVSSAMGSLLTGLLLAGSALVDVEATGDLSTGITLEGGAIVDSAAAFKPPGAEAQFGRAVILILSPTGLPVARSTFIAGSACIVTIGYFNANGDPFVPTAVNYSVQDESTGFTLVPATPISTPELSNAITITGQQNKMINLSRDFELHQVLFQITDGVGQVSYASADFELLRTPGTVN